MKTPGQIVASNLHACQIISGRDTERVARQIDASFEMANLRTEHLQNHNAKLRAALVKCRPHLPSHGTHAEDLINEVESLIP